MRFIWIPVLWSILSSAVYSQQSDVINKGDKLYLSNTVILKLKEIKRHSLSKEFVPTPGINDFLIKENVKSVRYLFDESEYRSSEFLKEILIVKYDSHTDPEVLSAKLKNYPGVEWCEPEYVYETDYIPNDQLYATQWHLDKIQSPQAWDVTKGDSTIIIAIVDTGIDWDHPDLSANIWINSDEIPGNGVDDDNNGFIDDIRGWDFGGLNGTPDNNPMEDRPDHGTHVAGIASAVTDNSIGVASIGYKSRLMAVKTSRDDVRDQSGRALISYGADGILYAANNGAKVINLSWGGGGYSVFLQETINYAVSQGALVVAAAGNNSSSTAFYPSAYNGVLSVASTGSDDKKSNFSNYGTTVDVSAPGSSINSTWQNDTYIYSSGTSMASPLTAGLAALVFHVFPSFNPLQVAEQIRANCDDIYSLNPTYNYLLGKGRINAFNAVGNTSSKSVRALNFVITDDAPYGDGDGIFEPGETLYAGIEFINYLNAVDNLVVTLTTLNSYSGIVNGTYNAGSRGTLESFNNLLSGFTFQLNSSIPSNSELTFKLSYSDGNYEDFQLFKVLVNPSYADQTNGNILLTIASDGTLGFNDFPNNTRGNGFKYMDGPNLLFEGALILGTSASKISDVARVSTTRHYEFATLQPFVVNIPGISADQEGLTLFNDDPAGSNKLGTKISLRSYSYSGSEDDDYIILRYNIKNTSSLALTGLYAGLFFDWDFADAVSDSTGYDPSGNLGYVYRTAGNPSTWVATASASQQTAGYYAIRNDGSQGNINLFDTDGYSDADKWTTISSGIGVQGAGPGDISQVVSNGAYDINPGDSVDAAFIIAAGNNLEALRTAVSRARIKYESVILDAEGEENPLPDDYSLSQNYPNPFNPSTVISYNIMETTSVLLRIYDITGQTISTLVNEVQNQGRYIVNFNAADYSSGTYFYELRAGEFREVKKMILLK